MRRREVSDLVDVFGPRASLLAKLGSIIVHVEEATGADGHAYDLIATRQLIADREVQEWLDGMRKAAMLPVKR